MSKNICFVLLITFISAYQCEETGKLKSDKNLYFTEEEKSSEYVDIEGSTELNAEEPDLNVEKSDEPETLDFTDVENDTLKVQENNSDLVIEETLLDFMKASNYKSMSEVLKSQKNNELIKFFTPEILMKLQEHSKCLNGIDSILESLSHLNENFKFPPMNFFDYLYKEFAYAIEKFTNPNLDLNADQIKNLAEAFLGNITKLLIEDIKNLGIFPPTEKVRFVINNCRNILDFVYAILKEARAGGREAKDYEGDRKSKSFDFLPYYFNMVKSKMMDSLKHFGSQMINGTSEIFGKKNWSVSGVSMQNSILTINPIPVSINLPSKYCNN